MDCYKWYKDNILVSTNVSYSENYYWNGYGGGSSQFNLRLEVRDALNTLISESKMITEFHSGGPLPSIGSEVPAPTEYTLMQNYPNPFNPITTISYNLPKTSKVRLTIYNTLGQVVKQYIDEIKPAGHHTKVWDGSNLASGVYIYRIQAGEFQQIKKMILLK
jgi:flagellar hook assembly protein FlgD